MSFIKIDRRSLGTFLVILALLGINARAASNAIARIKACSVSIAVYYSKTNVIADVQNEKLFDKYPVLLSGGGDYRVIIGSGTLFDRGYILTAGHVVNAAPESSRQIYVFFRDKEDFVKASVVAIVDEGPYDYAILKLEADMKIDGIKIAKKEAHEGDNVAWGGSPKRHAFFLRFGKLQAMTHYFMVEHGALSLREFDVPFWAIFPGESGDSGGGIFNSSGELISIIYLKHPINGQIWLLANPNSYLWKFLKDNNLEHLGE